jgi:hypothetical protein
MNKQEIKTLQLKHKILCYLGLISAISFLTMMVSATVIAEYESYVVTEYICAGSIFTLAFIQIGLAMFFMDRNNNS